MEASSDDSWLKAVMVEERFLRQCKQRKKNCRKGFVALAEVYGDDEDDEDDDDAVNFDLMEGYCCA